MINEYKFVRMFFLCLCLWTMSLNMGVFGQLATDNGATNLISMFDSMIIVMITVSTLFTFLMLIMGIISAINIWRNRSIDAGIDDYDEEEDKKRMVI